MEFKNQYFQFPTKLKNLSIILMAIGVLATIGGYIYYNSLMHHGAEGHHATNQVWSNLLVNSFYFMGVSLAALFFLIIQYIAKAGWAIGVRRIQEAITAFLPVGAVLMFIVFLAGAFHQHHIYHWMAEGITDPLSENYDEVIDGKSGYLNVPFFLLRAVVYFGVWVFIRNWFRKASLREDEAGYTVKGYRQEVRMAAIFTVFYAVTSSTSAWDWLMSIDTHWFSTMYGWYVFAGTFVSSFIVTIIIILYLHSEDLATHINENHLHDLAKFMFAFSVFWTYVWFSQFMLIWYANIPEEVTYFQDRFSNYKALFFINLLINFILPFFTLIMRAAKRNHFILGIVCAIIFFGHWLDVFLIVTPGVMKADWHFGIVEIGMFVGFTGLFSYVVLNSLSKASLAPKNNPYFIESITHHI